jgi:hypothetical protein
MMRQMSVPQLREWMAFYHLSESAQESDSLQETLEAAVDVRMDAKKWQP